MKQTLNIFRKDVRLFYVEILVSLAVTVLFVRLYPQTWGAPAGGIVVPQWLPATALGLVPVSWFVLITRVIQAESLVGERQFWLTRPYRWPNLLAAKALFIAAFVYLPFLLAQCALLKEAKMHPLAYLPGIFYNLLLATGIIVLPLAALAAVTANFAKMLLGLLLIVLYGAAVGFSTTLLPTSSSSSSFVDKIGFLGPFCVFVTVIVVQYARRRVVFSRWLLVAVALTIGITGLFGPEDVGMRMEYPVRAANPVGLQLAFKAPVAVEPKPREVFDEEFGREVELSFPVSISGILPGTAVKAEYANVKIAGSGGELWESHWQGTYLSWLPGETDATISLKVDRKFYDRVKAEPVTVELSVALTQLRAGKTTRTSLPRTDFTIPGGSICDARNGDTGLFSNDLRCRSPLRQPPLMLLVTRYSKDECSASAPANDGDNGVFWLGSSENDPADFGIAPVWGASINFQRVSSSQSSSEAHHLCPGSPLSFAPYTVVERRQQKIVSAPLVLSNLMTPGIGLNSFSLVR